MNDQTECEAKQKRNPRSCCVLHRANVNRCMSGRCERCRVKASPLHGCKRRPCLSTRQFFTRRCKAWNPGRPKRLNIPPHRRMVALIKAPPLLLRRGFVCASELRSERRVAYCSACGAQIQWSKEPVSQLRIHSPKQRRTGRQQRNLPL